MKLHLHLGAHKTATTHFQKVLEVNRCLYPSNISYIEMEQFRNNVRWKGDCVDLTVCGSYLEEIKNSSPTLVISEENLSGDTGNIHRDLFLYSRIENKLKGLECFTKAFDDIEIWFSVRSMDGFIPSVFCESLRHHRYRKFEGVYAGNYTQIWFPVIQSICRLFPNSRINVIRYENYTTILPLVIERIFGENEGWDYLKDERPRPSMNHYACKLMASLGPVIPGSVSSKLVQRLSRLLNDNNIGHKFAPFNQKQVDDLLKLYEKDIKAIKQIEQVFVY